MANITLHQVQPDVPIWDIHENGIEIGVATKFPGEGLILTVRRGTAKHTACNAVTLHDVVFLAAEGLAELDSLPDYGPIDDEDGSRACAEMLERRAEWGWWREEDGIPF